MTADAPAPSPDDGIPVDEIRRLIDIGRAQGTITVDEILVALGSPEPTHELIGAITELLANQGVAVDPEEPVEELRASTDAELATPPPRPAPRPRVPRERPLDTQRGGSSADPVRMYLKEIGRVPLLSGPEEVALAEVAIHLETTGRIRDTVTGLLGADFDLSGSDGDDPVGVQWAWLTRSWTPEHELPAPGNPLRQRYNAWDGLPRGIARGLPDPAVSILQEAAYAIALSRLGEHCTRLYATLPAGTPVDILEGPYAGAAGVVHSPCWVQDPNPAVLCYTEQPVGYAVRLAETSLAPDTHGRVQVPTEAVRPYTPR